MKRNQFGAALIAVLLFASGAAVGALGHRYYAEAVVSAKGPPDDFRQHYLSEMRTKLRLTAAQTAQLEAIMDETKARYKAVHDSNHPVMVKIKTEHIQRIKSILTPQQIPIYEQLVAEHERRAREMERRDH
jgi:Spy/CpxP family protein refolding chaperone